MTSAPCIENNENQNKPFGFSEAWEAPNWGVTKYGGIFRAAREGLGPMAVGIAGHKLESNKSKL